MGSKGNASSLCKIVFGIGLVLSILSSLLVFILRLEPLELYTKTRRFNLTHENVTSGELISSPFNLPVICPAKLGEASYKYKYVPGEVLPSSDLHQEMQKCIDNGVFTYGFECPS